MIISMWDNEQSTYPLLRIVGDRFEEFNKILKKYQKEEDYNNLDFYTIIKDKGILLEIIDVDKEVYF